MCVRRANICYYFDGTLSLNTEEGTATSYYVEKIPFENLSIGGYGDTDIHTVQDTIWIQSKVGMKNRVWYQLCNSAKEYECFYDPFSWLATFAKHFIDFLDETPRVTLSMFECEFWTWVDNCHGHDNSFRAWVKIYSDTDFRRVTSAHCSFLRNEARQIDMAYLEHPIWPEIDPQALTAVSAQPISSTLTIVTPFIHNCFSKMAWRSFMKSVNPKDHHLDRYATFSRQKFVFLGTPKDPIQCGDIVKIKRDQSGVWKTLDEIWLAYVQDVVIVNGKRALQILWLYRPADTICANMWYPYEDELFLSDHCECKGDPIFEDEIEGKASVAIFGSPLTTATGRAEYFMRQRYKDEAFESLEREHFECDCLKPKPFQCRLGETILIHYSDDRTVEVAEIVRFPSGVPASIRVRLLPRRQEFSYSTASSLGQPNELVYTERFADIPIVDMIRPCHVRFFSSDEEDCIPPPYSRGGTGDAFYILYREINVGDELEALKHPFPSSLLQSFVPPDSHMKRLQILDLFCGGGNFSRGIEEAGVAKVKWAVDYDGIAMHSYRANLESPDNVHLYLGSVNDYLKSALNDEPNPLIAKYGEVDMILAGSPCQGFSTVNKLRSNDQGLRNQSMIASVGSFIDFYRPKYALLENVKNVSITGKESEGQNAFSQMICTLVGMGYQVHQFCVDAWSMGSPQFRTRLFIAATAPGFVPLRNPPITHAHPTDVKSASLGKVANGLRFGARDLDAATIFPYVSIGEATKDLDYSFDGRAVSIKFPDHRITTNENTNARLRIGHIPRNPPKAGLGMAVRAGLLPQPLMETLTPRLREKLQQKSCGSYQRVDAQGLMPTVTTVCTPMDQYTGRILHWDCDRPLTVLEVRRAQGFLDNEIIVGSPAQQWKVVGNSVARPVALALGMALRKAWLACNYPDGVPPWPPFSFNLPKGKCYDGLEDEDGNPYVVKMVPASKSTSDSLAVDTTSHNEGQSKKLVTKRVRSGQKVEESEVEESEPAQEAKKKKTKVEPEATEDSSTGATKDSAIILE